MNFDWFLSNFTEFGRFFQKPMESEGGDFLVFVGFLSTGVGWMGAGAGAEGGGVKGMGHWRHARRSPAGWRRAHRRAGWRRCLRHLGTVCLCFCF
jgi:hypothetical protein